jgi:hypothetical protein
MTEWVSGVFCNVMLASCILSHLPDIEDVIRLYLGTCQGMRAIAFDDQSTRWAPIFDWKARLRARLTRFRAPGADDSLGVACMLANTPSFSLSMISRNWFYTCLGGCGCSASNVTRVTLAPVLPRYWCCVSCFLQLHHHEYAVADNMYFNMDAQGTTIAVGKCVSDYMFDYLLSMTLYHDDRNDWVEWCRHYHQFWHWPAVLKCSMAESRMQFLPIARIRQLMVDRLPEISAMFKKRHKRMRHNTQ